jgi:hypothetical protein
VILAGINHVVVGFQLFALTHNNIIQ